MAQPAPARSVTPARYIVIAKEVNDLLFGQLVRLAPKRARDLASSITDEINLMGEVGPKTLESLSNTLKRDPELAVKSVRMWLKNIHGKSLSTAAEAEKFFNTVVQIWYEDHHGMHEARKEARKETVQANVPAGVA